MIKLDDSGISELLDNISNPLQRKIIRLLFVAKINESDIAKELSKPKDEIEIAIDSITRYAKRILDLRICKDCGEKFYSARKNPKLCYNCKSHKAYDGKEKIKTNQNNKASAKNKSKKIKSLKQVIREMEKYNMENKTCLSYGQYCQKILGE